MEDIPSAIQECHQIITRIQKEISRHIVGQKELVNCLLTGLLTGGHVLIEGVPGLAKTRSVKALAAAIQADFKRIQFTPDLLPADLTGTEIFRPATLDFATRKGPLFTNILLADEINRAPSKVQSALLEAMEEKQVTIGEQTWPLPAPFLVLATQNPIEQEGTYPLPEAQVDRFMLKVIVGYPDRDQELQILEKSVFAAPEAIQPAIDIQGLSRMAALVDHIYVDDKLKEYIVDLVLVTRDPARAGLDLGRYIEFGASPRAGIFLSKASRVQALLSGRGYVTPEDIKIMGPNVLRHRILLSFEAEADGVTSRQVVAALFDTVPVP